MSGGTIIIQRLVPDYREVLFSRLHGQFGWKVAAAQNSPADSFMAQSRAASAYTERFACNYSDPENEYSCQFPLDEIIERMQPDRVIAEFSMANNLWRELPKLRANGRIKSYALWTHGWNMAVGFRSPSEIARQYGRLLPLSRANLVLTYTGEGKAWVQRWLPWKNAVALGNAIDVDAIRAVASKAKPERHGSPQLLSVGRLNAEKKYGALIAMFGELKAEFPNAALTIIGDGPERATLEAQAATFNDGSVKLLGAIRDEARLAPHFIAADYFIMAGAAGLSVNHALAYGLPVIAYGRGHGLPHNGPEIAYIEHGKTGLLCKSAAPGAMLDLIRTAIRDNLGQAMRQQIPQYVDAHMHVDHVVRQFTIADGLF